MGGSGLDHLWQTVYGANTVEHMLTRHAYSCALRAHLLTAAAITTLMIDTPDSLTGVNIQRIQKLHQILLKAEYPTDSIPNEIECYIVYTKIVWK